MDSTAALIPFDLLFKFTASELTTDYRVNLFKKVKEENAELLGMFGEEIGREKGSESEAEDEDEKGVERDNEKEDEKDNDNEDESDKTSDNKSDKNLDKKSEKMKKKQNKKVSRKMRELEYDYDDPFIDDSEITDVYQSVFELMRGGGGNNFENDSENENETGVNEMKMTAAKKERNFFVYRGTMTPEILAKEFEIDVEELFEDENGEEEGENEGEEGENGEKRVKKKRKSNNSNNSGAVVKKAKTVKPPAAVKEPKKPREPKEAKEPKKKKPSELIAQSAKKFNDLFISEDANEKASVAVVPVFNVNGVDANLLELREVLKRFRDAAVGTPFSPGKFPSVLRPRLNETICAVLRVNRPTPSALFPAKLFPALASFLPFSPSALNKLLTKKILGPLMEGIERNELPKMYETWGKMIEKRIIEGGFIEVPNNTTNTNVNNNNNTVTSDQPQLTSDVQIITTNTSPVKKRLKFNDEMRQQVFEIVRLESDLNNLICLSNFMESSNAAASTSTENVTNLTSIRSVQSELNLRKNVYQKLVNLSADANGSSLLSTTEISKEFGNQKRKHEKKVSKAADEILFGEGEVEELLKELDVRKEAPVVSVTENTQATATTQQQVVMDPLNLFNNDDQSNTSLFIDSNPNKDNNEKNN